MRKPQYMQGVFAIIFAILGVTFLISGIFPYVGLMKVGFNSTIQDGHSFGLLFAAIGLVCSILSVPLFVINHRKVKLREELLISGRKCYGIVERVKCYSFIHINGRSPYIIYYSCQDAEAKVHRSHLLWDKPKIEIGSSVRVYLNESGQSAIENPETIE